jgi:hypothetical protein
MDAQVNSICLAIGGFSIRLSADRKIQLEDGYLPFVENQNVENPDFTIRCVEHLPSIGFDASDLLFQAENEFQKFYSIYRNGNQLAFVIYNQQTNNEVQQVAFLDENFKHWTIHCEVTDGLFLPLRYPMGPIVMHYITIKTNAVMMHASCAYDGKKARLFTGFSGAGKSTMSMLWSKAGRQIINDDRLIVRKQDGVFFVYNTPMYYKDIPKKAPLSSIFLISHSPENRIKKLSGAMSITRVMAFSIQNNFDRRFIEGRLDLFTELCSQVGVYELGFVPDESVVNFVLDNE